MKTNVKSIIAKNSIKVHRSFYNFKEDYEQIDELKHKKAEEYLSELKVFNKVTGEVKGIEYDKEWTLRQNYLYRTFVADDIRYHAHEMGYEAFFITATLPSEYHPFNTSKSNGKSYRNRRYKGYSIQDGAEKLKEFCRALTNDFKVGRRRIKTKFVRVVEPHKSFVAHNHMLIFVPKNLMSAFVRHHQLTINRFGFDRRGQDIKDLSNSKDPKKVTTYLFKYVQKTLDGTNAWINGWLKENKISRVMTNSRGSMSREIFKKLSSIQPHNPKDDKPYLVQLRNVSLIEIEKVDKHGKYLLTEYKKPFNGAKEIYKIFKRQVVEVEEDIVEFKRRQPFEYYCDNLTKEEKAEERESFKESMEGREFEGVGIIDEIEFKGEYEYIMRGVEEGFVTRYRTIDLIISKDGEELYNKRNFCLYEDYESEKEAQFFHEYRTKRLVTVADYEEIIYNETVMVGGF